MVFILLNFTPTFSGLVGGYFWEVFAWGGSRARVGGMRYEFELPYPPSLNTYYRHVGAKVLISERGRAYRSEVERLVRALRSRGSLGPEALEGRLGLRVAMNPPDNRKRDIDNILKATLDALTHAGLWCDDSQVDRLTIERGACVRGGRLSVCVATID